jgi:lysyl-tRNA synthetase class 2
VPNNWRPTCSIEMMRLRAQLLADIRQFFSARAVLEVETPVLSHSSGTDPQLDFFTTDYCSTPLEEGLFLQTSPEFAMKRLLAAGSGSIYQIAKAFRNGESGRFHNPEFTLLEWYRVGFTLPQLMDEIAELMAVHTGLNPLEFSYESYSDYAQNNHVPEAMDICGYDHSLWLDFIFTHYIQPYLGESTVCMVYGYPACQSSLARINERNSQVSDRVEVFINGIELGNGYYELTDAKEQGRRFDGEQAIRQQRNRPVSVKDMHLIEALEAGLPECSGMAIGLDRLLMLLTNSSTIEDVLNFPISRA